MIIGGVTGVEFEAPIHTVDGLGDSNSKTPEESTVENQDHPQTN